MKQIVLIEFNKINKYIYIFVNVSSTSRPFDYHQIVEDSRTVYYTETKHCIFSRKMIKSNYFKDVRRLSVKFN